jgi:hypothetical protein
MIISPTLASAVMHHKQRELRFPYTAPDPHEPCDGTGELVPLRTQPGREPACWITILDSWPDDATSEYVYTIARVPTPDTPRLLTPAGRPRGSELGYTDKPYLSMIDEPEAVDPDTQEALTLAAIGRDAKRRREHSIAAQRERALLTILERIALARTAAANNGISVHSELKAVTRMHQRGRSEGLISAELERVERIAYRDAA